MPARGGIVNLKNFTRKMSRLKDAARADILLKAANAGGAIIEAQAKINIRAQDLIDTGNLLNSIQKQHEHATGRGAEVQIGTGVVYARIHELGGVIPNAFGRNIIINVPARPYLRPALDENQDAITSAVAEVIKRELWKANGSRS